MLDNILHEMESLSLRDKRSLIEATKAAVARELGAQGSPAPAACPRCGSARFVRKGRGRDGSQRWLCRGCGRTFSAKTMGLLGYSKLPAETWARYVEAMLGADGTLRRCAKACSVGLKTSWFMRMRVCEVMGRALQPFRVGESVSWQVDGTYLDESLSGNRSRGEARMPRKPHRHGGSVHARGISNLKVCVVCGANDLGDSFCRVCDRGRPSESALGRALEGIGGGSWVSTDGHGAYERVLPALGAEHVAVGAARQLGGELGLVDALHQRLKLFLPRFHGVSTRRLSHYLDWFEWTEQVRRSDASQSDVLPRQAAQGRYENTRRALFEEPQPFWDYWEERMSTVV